MFSREAIERCVLAMYIMQIGDPRLNSEKWAGKSQAYVISKLMGWSEHKTEEVMRQAADAGYLDREARDEYTH